MQSDPMDTQQQAGFQYPSADDLITRKIDAAEFVRLFHAATAMHLKRHIPPNQYYGHMQAAYAKHTVLTGILNRIPHNRTGTLVLIQEALAESLRPTDQNDEDNQHIADYMACKQSMVPAAPGSTFYRPQTILEFMEDLDKKLLKIPLAQRPTQQAQVAHIVHGLFDEIRRSVPYQQPPTVEELRPMLLKIEDMTKSHNPMLAPHLVHPPTTAATYATFLSGGGGGFVPPEQQQQPADTSQGKAHDHANETSSAIEQSLEEKKDFTLDAKMDRLNARLDTFYTSMQANNKRKREDDDQEEASKKRPPYRDNGLFCKLCKKKGHSTARCRKKCHSCFNQHNKIILWQKCMDHNEFLRQQKARAENTPPPQSGISDMKTLIKQTAKETIKQMKEDEMIANKAKAALKEDRN